MATFSVRKRNDLKKPTWQYDVRDSSLPNGKLRKSGFKTKAEAQQAAQTVIRKIDDGIAIQNDVTFSGYFDSWMDSQNKKALSPGQYDWYIRAKNMFTEKYGENKLIKTITRTDVQGLLNQYAEGRTKESVRKVKDCLTGPLRDAVYEGLIQRDPTYNLKNNGTKLPQSPEDKYVTLTQYFKLIEFFKSKDHLSYVLLYLLAITGARFSEVNQMTWKDLNKAPGLVHLIGTKTDTSPRDIELSAKDIEYVKTCLSSRPRRIDGKLFNLSNSAASKTLKLAQKTIGMDEDDYVTIYGLRHTHASFLISKDFNITYISKRLGHANPNTTLRVYSHLFAEHREKEGNRIRTLEYK